MKRLAGALLLSLLALGGGPGEAQAQVPPALPAAPTPTPEDLLRAQQRQRLERLSRSPGQDTIGLVPDTSAAPPRPGTAVLPNARPPAASAFDIGTDTVVARLLSTLIGYDPVEYEAASARFEAGTRNLFLQGDTARRVAVRYDENEISADSSITYNQVSDYVDARGRPIWAGREGDPVVSRRLLVDTRTREASAFGATTRHDVWNLTGDIPRISRELVYASHARFTSCDLTVPHYHFEARRIKIVLGQILVAAPVTLYFGDVPVFWVPFIAQSLASGRASGLLTPRFSLNDVVRSSGGYARRISNVGFYWAMSDYTDATVALDWFSGNFTALTGSLRYRWAQRFLSGTLSGRQFWRDQGGTEFSLNGQHAWQISERSTMNAQIAYVSSTDFLRRNTFDPMEATQQITSSGGLTRRFDWGQLNLLANRSQSLSDDRVDMTLPRATLSLKTITLFPAPPARAAWYNNVTWSGGASVARRTLDFPEQPPGGTFRLQRLDQATTNVAANHSIGIGNLGFSQDVRLQESGLMGVPRDTLPFFPGPETGRVDVRDASLDWSTSLSYQQTLVGSTSITPIVSISSQAVRSDTLELAPRFVSGPTRVSFGAALSSHLYGFFPGFGPFEAVRHRVSPGVNYQWSPEVRPTELQRQVFGSRTLQPQSLLTLSFSQTFEAKRTAPPEPAAPAPLDRPASLPGDTLAVPDAPPAPGPGEPLRRPPGQIVTLLSLHTSSLTYDFVQADSAGQALQGFTTTRLRNEVGSDYLRGLSLSFEHDLFQDSTVSSAPGSFQFDRRFAPHLSAVNLRFSVNASSGLLRWLGLGGEGEAAGTVSGETDFEDDPFADRRSVADEASILPGRGAPRQAPQQGGRRRDWNAGVTYALTRPRERGAGAFQENSQNLRFSITGQPTDAWTLGWRTSYDLELGGFSDHMVTLSRDLHRWQANFDFLKTATGNWAFRFEVSLLDNQDLRFDFDQRSVESGGPRIPTP